MFQESLRYVQNGEEWPKTVLIGGVLTLFSFLLVPYFAVMGYAMRVLRSTMVGDERPPAFDRWGDLLVDGLKAFAVTLIYGLVPAIVVGVFGGIGLIGIFTVSDSASGTATGAGAGAALSGVVVLVGLAAGLALSLLAAYAVPAALANYAQTGRLGAAFDFGALRPVLTSGTYAAAWVVALAITVAAGVVVGLLNAVPLVGFVVGGFVSFYALVASAYVVGTAWGELHPVEIGENGGIEERPAI